MKFKELIKKLEIDERFTKPRTNVQTVFNKIKDNIPMIEDFNFMADVLYLPETKEKYKYLLVVVDLATNEFDIEPLRNIDTKTTAEAFQTMMKRKYLNFPKVIRTDDGSEFKDKFTKMLTKNDVLQKVAMPKRHKQMSVVESLNKQLGRLFNGYMNLKEKKTGKVYREWTDILSTVREDLNKIRKFDIKKDVSEFDYPFFDPDTEPKYKVGDTVHEKLDYPENALGNKQSTENFRVGDVRYSMVPKKIEKIIYMNTYPYYRYILSGNKKASYSEYELIKSRFQTERYQVKEIIDVREVGRRKEYLVWWKGYKKKQSTWEPRANLIKDGLKNLIDEFDVRSHSGLQA
jgi:hypothetical protein